MRIVCYGRCGFRYVLRCATVRRHLHKCQSRPESLQRVPNKSRTFQAPSGVSLIHQRHCKLHCILQSGTMRHFGCRFCSSISIIFLKSIFHLILCCCISYSLLFFYLFVLLSYVIYGERHILLHLSFFFVFIFTERNSILFVAHYIFGNEEQRTSEAKRQRQADRQVDTHF